MLLRASASVYVDTTGTPPTNPAEAHPLAAGKSIIIGAGITVNVRPVSREAVAYAQPI
jgi:hypothetical protein